MALITESPKNTVNNVNIVNILGKVIDDKILLETVFSPNNGTLDLAVSFSGKNIKFLDTYEHNGVVYAPMDNKYIRTGHILTPSGYIDYGTPQILLGEILEFIHQYVDLDPAFEEVAARYIMMTWVYDKYPRIPYLRVLGHGGSGKTRFLNVLREIAYHPTNLGQAITTANIYRWLNKYPGTLIMDEANFQYTDKTNPITQILNSGYEKGGGVTRTKGTDYSEEDFFSSFGPKIFGAHQPYSEQSLEQRFLSSILHPTKRDICIYLPDRQSWQDAIVLRQKLLFYRLQEWVNININKIPKDLKNNYSHRTIEIFAPLLTCTYEKTLPNRVKNFIDYYVGELQAQYSLSLEGMAAEAIVKLYKPGEKLYIKDITKTLNQLQSGAYSFSEKKVGGLATSLGLSKSRTRSGTIVIVNDQIIEHLVNHFNIPSL